MSENRVNLNDPSCEPTDEDFERLFRAAGDDVRAESACLNSRSDVRTGPPESTDPDYLAWVEQQIAEGQEQMRDPSKRSPAAKVREAFGLDH